MVLLKHLKIVEIVLKVWAMVADFLNQEVKLQVFLLEYLNIGTMSVKMHGLGLRTEVAKAIIVMTVIMDS